MATVDEEDPFASLIYHCLCSSSQEDLLARSIFADEDATFADDDGDVNLPAAKDSGGIRLQLNGSDGGGERNRGKLAPVGGDSTSKRNLGFQGEEEERERSTIEAACDGEVRVSEAVEMELEREVLKKQRLIEPPLKKPRVSSFKSPNSKGEKVSPLVKCSEKMVIESEGGSCNVKVEIVSPLNWVAPDSVQSIEKLGLQVEDESIRENSAKKKLEFGEEEPTAADNEKELHIEGGSSIADINGDGSANPKDDQNRSVGSSKGIDRQGKRALPRSLIGRVSSSTFNGGEGTSNGVTQNGNKEGGLNLEEESVVTNGNEKPKVSEPMRCLMDVLRVLASETCYSDDDDGEVDIFETAKRRGMKFPRNRFRSPEPKEDE